MVTVRFLGVYEKMLEKIGESSSQKRFAFKKVSFEVVSFPKKFPFKKKTLRTSSTPMFPGWWQLKHVLFSSLPGEMIQFDLRIFLQMGWFNHHPQFFTSFRMSRTSHVVAGTSALVA